MMHTCSLVQISNLQDKLHELIPIAEQALSLKESESSHQIQLTALQLFRKILIVDKDKRDQTGVQSSHLDTFLPYILQSLQQLSKNHASSENQTVLKIEGLHTLTQVALEYSQQKSAIKRSHVERVSKVVSEFLDDKKRVVRKFARTCINEWQTSINN